MSQVYYPAIIERAEDGFSVYFPDLPGCVSAGATIQEAARNAEEALSLHLLGMVEDGDMIPAPTDIDQAEREPQSVEVCRILVRADMPGRKQRVNVMMDEGLLASIDKLDKNRSRFIDQAVRQAISARRVG